MREKRADKLNFSFAGVEGSPLHGALSEGRKPTVFKAVLRAILILPFSFMIQIIMAYKGRILTKCRVRYNFVSDREKAGVLAVQNPFIQTVSYDWRLAQPIR